MNLTATEIRVLQNIHLTGTMGKCGSLNQSKRGNILAGLIEKKLLRSNGTITPLGIEVSRPMNTLK